MKVAIVGSRNFPNMQQVLNFVAKLQPDTVVVSGGANGVDSVAEAAARERGLEVQVFYPDWDKYGLSAGPKRNEQIVKAADWVVAFWDGASRGTLSSINLAKYYNTPYTVYRPEKTHD